MQTILNKKPTIVTTQTPLPSLPLPGRRKSPCSLDKQLQPGFLHLGKFIYPGNILDHDTMFLGLHGFGSESYNDDHSEQCSHSPKGPVGIPDPTRVPITS